MKTNTLREKLRSGTPTIGGWLTLNNSALAELMASVGYDWIVVDCEHSTISFDDLLHICQGIDCAGNGAVPIARVATPDHATMKRTLDTGVKGVVVPMLETPQQFEEAVAAARFAPEGVRGICSARANRWDMEFDEYTASANSTIMVIAQIERIKAVERIEEILAVDGIDAVVIGPDDLSASMGYRGNSGHPDVTAAIDRVFEACRRANIPYGRHVMTVEAAVQHINMGCTFVPLSQDIDTFWEAALAMVNSVRNAVAAGSSAAGVLHVASTQRLANPEAPDKSLNPV